MAIKTMYKVDKDSKLIIDFEVTSAEIHDSQCFRTLLDNKDKEVWADSGYVGEDLHEDILKEYPDIELHVCEKGYKNKPLTTEQRENNKVKSKARVRAEHVFGHITNTMGGMFIRCIGIARAIREIAMKNLAYNLQRFAYLSNVAKRNTV